MSDNEKLHVPTIREVVGLTGVHTLKDVGLVAVVHAAAFFDLLRAELMGLLGGIPIGILFGCLMGLVYPFMCYLTYLYNLTFIKLTFVIVRGTTDPAIMSSVSRLLELKYIWWMSSIPLVNVLSLYITPFLCLLIVALNLPMMLLFWIGGLFN